MSSNTPIKQTLWQFNSDYAQYKALADHDREIEDMKLGLQPKSEVKPLAKVVEEVFKPVIIKSEENK